MDKREALYIKYSYGIITFEQLAEELWKIIP